MIVNRAQIAVVAVGLLGAVTVACNDKDTPTTPSAMRNDAAVFRQITQTEPFGAYMIFPRADEFTTGRLSGSEAHAPTVRVSLNAIASGALQNGRLGSGARFPDGSIVFKAISSSATAAPNTYAVMVKDSTHPMAANGWLWAEFAPDGSTRYSITNRGGACTSCHSREQGPANDLVRTFERQRQ